MVGGGAIRAEEVVARVERDAGRACVACGAPVCGHEVVMNLVAGHSDRPRCAPCLATALGQAPAAFRARLIEVVRHTACYAAGWSRADRGEPGTHPWPVCRRGAACSRGASVVPAGTADGADAEFPDAQGEPVAESMASGRAYDAYFDAGDMGCGDLVLELRIRMGALAPGAVLAVRATDPGAPQDLPAWCRLTGHRLLLQDECEFWIGNSPATDTKR